MAVTITDGTHAVGAVGAGATTGDLIARVGDLIGEETADFYSIATDILPALNEGKDIAFTELEYQCCRGDERVCASYQHRARPHAQVASHEPTAHPHHDHRVRVARPHLLLHDWHARVFHPRPVERERRSSDSPSSAS
jgi:hypothetical protein